MRVLKPKSIFTLLYGLGMLVPCFAIGVTCAYVQFNKNAYQSYSGSASEIEKIKPVNNVDDLIQNVNYMYVYTETEGTQVARQITFNSISIDWDSYGFPNRNYTSFFTLNSYFYAYYDNYDDVNHREIKQIWGTTLTSFTFNFKSADGTTNLNKGNNQIYLPIFISDSLDNVFYYAVNKFTDDNNFGEIDFFQWFRGMFLSDNVQNNQWFNFFNWYMNYALLFSSAYILFLSMMWFINFARKVLEKGFNYDW